MKTKILITGGCGKIGAYFAKFAMDRYLLRIVDRVPWDAEKHGNLPGENRIIDLQDLDACREACQGIDMVVHLAADASPEADFFDSLLGNNIVATYNIFRAAQESGCKRLIYVSSAHVASAYPPDIQVRRDMAVRPGNLYGVSKCFGEVLAAHFAYNEGLPCIALLESAEEELTVSWSQQTKTLTDWLRSLPLPCGVFAVHDHRAQFRVEACAEAGLRIPEDIALIGMDNDEIICEHSVPTLSSVSGNSEQVGWEAMGLLDRMMQGEPWPTEDLLVEPDRVPSFAGTSIPAPTHFSPPPPRVRQPSNWKLRQVRAIISARMQEWGWTVGG